MLATLRKISYFWFNRVSDLNCYQLRVTEQENYRCFLKFSRFWCIVLRVEAKSQFGRRVNTLEIENSYI